MTPKSQPGSVLGFAVLCLLLAANAAHAEAPDLNRPIRWSIPAGNIWTTMEMYRAAAGALVRVRCNYCSGAQPCSSADLTSGSCVPQCPGPDQPDKVVSRACSLPCNALYSITTQAIEGEYQLFDALEHMLEGTGVTFALLTRSDTNSVEVILLDARRHFNIPAGPTTQTAMEFTRQSGVRLLMTSELNRRAQTSAVKGYLTPEEALNRMLQDTTLVYHRIRTIDDGVFVTEDRSQQVLVLGNRQLTGMETLTVAQLQSVTQQEMKTADFGTAQDVIRRMPVTVLAGMKEDFDRGENLARGTAINLRGVGPGATLVLVNGRRQPSSGVDGNFVDVSTIPWAAVDRIDVLPDGASATYGTGAIGGVVNIIMRKDSEGVETRLRDAEVQGGATERIASQLFAGSWDTGSALFAYQFSMRDALPYNARGYSRNTDKRSYGGIDWSVTSSNPGTIFDPNTLLPAYAIPSAQNGAGLDFKDLIPGANYSNYLTTADLVPGRRAHSGYLSLSQHLGDRWVLDGDVRFHARDTQLTWRAQTRQFAVPRSNPYFLSGYEAPFLLVDYSFIDDLGPQTRDADVRTYSGALTLSGSVTQNWRTSVTASHGQERLRAFDRNMVNDTALEDALADTNALTAFNPFGAGSHTNPATLEKIRSVWARRTTSMISEFSATLDGPLAIWRNGELRLSTGTSIRWDRLKRSASLGSFASASHPARESRSVFAEVTAPLTHSLSLSVAGRIERFGTRDAAAPKVALRWAPSDSMHMRGSWSHAYRQPDLVQTSTEDGSGVGFLAVPDPQSATGRSLALVRAGGNPDLREETAKSWTAGMDLAWRQTQGTLSLTYFSIDYDGRVVEPGTIPTIFTLQQEDEWSNIITRQPSRALIEALCRSPNLFGSQTDCLASSPTIIDGRLRNGGRTHLRGIDWLLEQPFDTPYGQLALSTAGTHLFAFKTANGSVLPDTDVLSTTGNPPRTRLRASINWYQRAADKPGLSAGAGLSHMSAFQDPNSTKLRNVKSSMELDLNLSYRSDRGGWLDATELILNVANIANDPPPFIDLPIGYDTANNEPYGRVISFSFLRRF